MWFTVQSIPPPRSSGSQACAQVPTDAHCPTPAREPWFPLHWTWKRLNSWRKIGHGEGEYVSPKTPAGVGRFETWTADYPIHHFTLSLMEVNNYSSRRTTLSKAHILYHNPACRYFQFNFIQYQKLSIFRVVYFKVCINNTCFHHHVRATNIDVLTSPTEPSLTGPVIQ